MGIESPLSSKRCVTFLTYMGSFLQVDLRDMLLAVSFRAKTPPTFIALEIPFIAVNCGLMFLKRTFGQECRCTTPFGDRT